MRDNSQYLQTLKRKYLAIRSAELLLYCLSVCSVVFLLTRLFSVTEPIAIVVTMCSGVLFFFVFFFSLKLNSAKDEHFITFINQRYPEVQQSADLLFMDLQRMSALQQIQREKIEEQFQKMYGSITLPNRIPKALLFSAAIICLSFALHLLLNQTSAYKERTDDPITQNDPIPTGLPASIKSIAVNVRPPAYTGLRSFETANPDLAIPSGSEVSWQIEFSDSVASAALVFSNGDSLMLSGTARETLRKSFSESSLYRIAWKNLSGQPRSSKHFKVEAIHDEPPKIAVHNQPQYRELNFSDDLSFNLRSSLSDDYALKAAYIIATVSKGTGESVKFREEKISFVTPAKIKGRNVKATAKIDLIRLGLTPGDELYFYIEALDNRSPVSNSARTETFFVALRDTASGQFVTDGGMGADLMPEYFRSQRQIIIDSEKLLREKRAIQPVEFSRRSNELGYDQKMLRLKYGEFLGEEFETSIGPTAEEHADQNHDRHGDEEDPLKEYTHQHDTGNEHNLVPETRNVTHHDDEAGIENSEDPAAAYRHVHDDPEEATFFTESIRTKLKAALAFMWDAELHLRLAEPARSLPYQYKALRLLKEISNASRIYVHKTGFDPPPLKEDKRLTGDLSGIRSSRHQEVAEKSDELPAVRNALVLTEEKLLHEKILFTQEETDAMQRAGNELAARSLQEPGKYLAALAAINSLNENLSSDNAMRSALLLIRKAFWMALPEETKSPVKSRQSLHPLDVEFVERLQSINE